MRNAAAAADAAGRARVRALALSIAADAPLGNLRVLKYLTGQIGVAEEVKLGWQQHWLRSGLATLEACWPMMRAPAVSATATRHRWPIAAWCRRCSTRSASVSTPRLSDRDAHSRRMQRTAGLPAGAPVAAAGRGIISSIPRGRGLRAWPVQRLVRARAATRRYPWFRWDRTRPRRC
jgi:hypothetical protein